MLPLLLTLWTLLLLLSVGVTVILGIVLTLDPIPLLFILAAVMGVVILLTLILRKSITDFLYRSGLISIPLADIRLGGKGAVILAFLWIVSGAGIVFLFSASSSSDPAPLSPLVVLSGGFIPPPQTGSGSGDLSGSLDSSGTLDDSGLTDYEALPEVGDISGSTASGSSLLPSSMIGGVEIDMTDSSGAISTGSSISVGSGFQIIAPSENPYTTSESFTHLQGSVPENTVQYIEINKSRLKSFEPYAMDWIYVTETLGSGSHLFSVDFYDKKSQKIHSDSITIIRK